MTEPKTDGFVKGDGARNPNKSGFHRENKKGNETKKKEGITYRAKE